MKKIIFTSLIAALFLVSLASAYHYGQSETVTYTEDIQGENRGFTLKHSTTGPSYHECNGFYYFSYDNPCTPLNTAYPIYNGYGSTWDRSRGMPGYSNRNSQQDHVALAFKTFGADSQKQLDNERRRTELRYRGYGYSNFYGYGSYYPRYYSWGW